MQSSSTTGLIIAQDRTLNDLAGFSTMPGRWACLHKVHCNSRVCYGDWRRHIVNPFCDPHLVKKQYIHPFSICSAIRMTTIDTRQGERVHCYQIARSISVEHTHMRHVWIAGIAIRHGENDWFLLCQIAMG